MNRKSWITLIVAAVAVLVVVCALSQTATACPTCTKGLADGDEASQRMIQGYFWSIIFMMSMPFAILFGVGGYMYREVKRAQAKANAERESASAVAAMPPYDVPADDLAVSSR
jgi:hypothetical protein